MQAGDLDITASITSENVALRVLSFFDDVSWLNAASAWLPVYNKSHVFASLVCRGRFGGNVRAADAEYLARCAFSIWASPFNLNEHGLYPLFYTSALSRVYQATEKSCRGRGCKLLASLANHRFKIFKRAFFESSITFDAAVVGDVDTIVWLLDRRDAILAAAPEGWAWNENESTGVMYWAAKFNQWHVVAWCVEHRARLPFLRTSPWEAVQMAVESSSWEAVRQLAKYVNDDVGGEKGGGMSFKMVTHLLMGLTRAGQLGLLRSIMDTKEMVRWVGKRCMRTWLNSELLPTVITQGGLVFVRWYADWYDTHTIRVDENTPPPPPSQVNTAAAKPKYHKGALPCKLLEIAVKCGHVDIVAWWIVERKWPTRITACAFASHANVRNWALSQNILKRSKKPGNVSSFWVNRQGLQQLQSGEEPAAKKQRVLMDI